MVVGTYGGAVMVYTAGEGRDGGEGVPAFVLRAVREVGEPVFGVSVVQHGDQVCAPLARALPAPPRAHGALPRRQAPDVVAVTRTGVVALAFSTREA